MTTNLSLGQFLFVLTFVPPPQEAEHRVQADQACAGGGGVVRMSARQEAGQ